MFSCGAAVSVVLVISASALAGTAFTHVERKELGSTKEEFIRAAQTVELGNGPYFVDVKAALSNPVELGETDHALDLFVSNKAYHIEGDLYLKFQIDEEDSVCYIIYYKDGLQADTYSGRILYREGSGFLTEHPDPTAEDLTRGIENEEVFFLLCGGVSAEVVGTTVIHGYLGRYIYTSEKYVEVKDDRYVLADRITQNYPYIVYIGFAGVIAAAIVCAMIYNKKRTEINFRLE